MDIMSFVLGICAGAVVGLVLGYIHSRMYIEDAFQIGLHTHDKSIRRMRAEIVDKSNKIQFLKNYIREMKKKEKSNEVEQFFIEFEDAFDSPVMDIIFGDKEDK